MSTPELQEVLQNAEIVEAKQPAVTIQAASLQDVAQILLTCSQQLVQISADLGKVSSELNRAVQQSLTQPPPGD